MSIINLTGLKRVFTKRKVVLFLFLFLISSLSFGLGYLAASEYNKAPIIIESCK